MTDFSVQFKKEEKMIMININKLDGGNITITTKPVANPKTKITFTDGTSQEYDWKGEIK